MRSQFLIFGALLLVASAQVDFGDIATVESIGRWPGNPSAEWYNSNTVCNKAEGQYWYFKHKVNDISFSRLADEEAASESWSAYFQLVFSDLVQPLSRLWKYVMKVDEYGDTFYLWENLAPDAFDVHVVSDSENKVRRCCWYPGDFVHNFCISPPLSVSSRIGSGISGTAKYRFVGRIDRGDAMANASPFRGDACLGADSSASRLLADMSDVEAAQAHVDDRLLRVNQILESTISRTPDPPSGWRRIRKMDFHIVESSGTLKRIDYLDEDAALVFYEDITSHSRQLPSNYDDVKFPPEVLLTKEKCEAAEGVDLDPPADPETQPEGPNWLFLLAMSSVLGAVLLGAFYAARQNQIAAANANGAADDLQSRMSGTSGLTRGPVMGSAKRMTGTSAYTRGPSGGSKGKRMTGTSAFTRGPSSDGKSSGSRRSNVSGGSRSSRGSRRSKVSNGTRRSGGSKGNRMTGVSGFTRGGGASTDNVSAGTRATTGTQMSRVSNGSRRSGGSKRSRASGGSKRSRGSRRR